MVMSGNYVRRLTNTGTHNFRMSGLPIVPAVTDAPQAGDVYPSVRATGWSNSVLTVPRYTWMATVESANMATIIFKGSSNSAICYYYFDLTSSPPSTFVRSGRRPLNPQVGFPRYNVSLGTASLVNAGLTWATAAANVEHEQVVSGTSIVDCSKLPPLCQSNGSVLIATTPGGAYNSDDFITWNPALPPFPTVPTWKCYRWLGGAMTIANAASVSVDVYVLQIDPGTLIGDTSAEVNVATVASGGSATVSAATLGASLTRWGHFWVYVKKTVPGANAGLIRIVLFSPTDVPPTYDCPARDGMVMGGYLS